MLMRSYLDIIIDLKDGKEVSKEELGVALLFANDQLNFAINDVNKCLDGRYDKSIIREMVIKNRESRFKARKLPLEKWFGYIPTIK